MKHFLHHDFIPQTGKGKLRSSHLLFQSLVFFMFSFIFLYPQFAKAIPDFTFSVEATPESCPSNGTLKFSVSQTEPSAVITYTIYLLPELSKPFKVQQSPTLSSLRAGEYRIIATQEFNGESNNEKPVSYTHLTLPTIYSV